MYISPPPRPALPGGYAPPCRRLYPLSPTYRYKQLELLRSEDYVVLNYTDLLLRSQDYAAPLASFLELPSARLGLAPTRPSGGVTPPPHSGVTPLPPHPPSRAGKNVARAFTLSIKAKPKRKNNGSVALDVPSGAWSDADRRTYIETRLDEVTKSPTSKPRCCDAWVKQMARTRVAHMPSLAPPKARGAHWFTRWASHAEPPRRVEEISFTHVINPFRAGDSSEHLAAQKATLDSIVHASSLAFPQVVMSTPASSLPSGGDAPPSRCSSPPLPPSRRGSASTSSAPSSPRTPTSSRRGCSTTASRR